jgi:hypothetical protein
MNSRRDKQRAALAEDTAKREKIELRAAPPTYPVRNHMPVGEARVKIAQAFARFLQAAEEWWPERLEQIEAKEQKQEIEIPPPPVKGIKGPTGSSKTQIAAKLIAADRKARRRAGDTGPMATLPWLYLGPIHRLNDTTAKQFHEEGLTAKVVYGREQWDRSIPGNADLPKDKQVPLCSDLPKVNMAIACGQSVITTCCEGFGPRPKEDDVKRADFFAAKLRRRRRKKEEKQRCAFRDGCPYWEQLSGDVPDVWIAAHNALFHPQKEFKNIAGVIIDESFYETGLYGVAKIKTREDEEPGFNLDDIAEKEAPHRDKLIELLRTHPMGGLHRDRFVDEIDPDECTAAIIKEFEIADRLKITPQMTPAQFEQAKQDMPTCQRARHMVPVWGALRELLRRPEIDVSGRLVLTQNKKTGKIYLRARGVKDIVADRKVPTILLDATLPPKLILDKFYPQIDDSDITDIDVDVPKHVHVKQVIGAPVSIRKLFGTKKKPAVGEQSLKSVRRYIQKWWLGEDRKEMLVICQMDVEKWLKDMLPPEIKLEHYNNTRGLDIYRLVPSMLTVGRTIPSPASVEAQAGALTGAEPANNVLPGQWYEQVPRAIRMADGSGIVVEHCDQHPDPLCEALRWQVCEAEVMQSLGRARWINRDSPDTALKVGVITNTVLPITVNKVELWQAPSAAVEMPVDDGWVLTVPTDMVKAWPVIWPTVGTAKWTLEKLRALAPRGRLMAAAGISIGYIPIEFPAAAIIVYRRAAASAHRAVAYVDLRKWPNPRAWLVEKLGALADLFHILEKRDIPPMAGASSMDVDDAKVTVLKAPAKLPWSAPTIEEITDPEVVRAILAEYADGVDIYSTLPIELRLSALCLPLPPENSRRHDGQEAA